MDQAVADREFRVHERKVLRTTAEVIVPGRPIVEVRTLDISAGGLAIVAGVSPSIGLGFGLRLALPLRGGRSGAIESMVQVMHSVFNTSDGGFRVGLRFVGLPPAAAAVLLQFLTD